MATFNGGTSADNYTGTIDADQANGNGGNDILDGAGGDDTLDGGDNNDRLIGGAGADTLTGGDGFDILFSDADNPAYSGPLGHDASYDIGTEHDVLNGGAGDDTLFVGIGDSADGGTYTFRGNKLSISFRGGTAGVNADFRGLANNGTVTIAGGTYANIQEVLYIDGTDYDDLLAGFSIFTGLNTAGGFSAHGYGGNDTIVASLSSGHGPSGLYGGDGDDLIDDRPSFYGSQAYGEAGNDHIIGSNTGAGSYYGGDGDDVLEGNGWIDNLYGDAGNDILDGGSNRDNVFGGDGNDTIYGAGDSDTLEGGDGDDVIYGDFSLISTANELSGNVNDDVLRGGAGIDMLYGEQGNDTLDGGTGVDTMRGSTGNDVYYVDDAGDVVEENAAEGIDQVFTSLATYSLIGTNLENLSALDGAAHDFRGNASDNIVVGGAGDDLLRLGDGGNDNTQGAAGADVIYFGAAFTGTDVANGGDGRDVVVLQGNYTMTLSATNLVAVESLSLQSGSKTTWGDTANNFYDYNITMADANTPAGGQMIVNGQSLRVGEDFTFDGSAETNGKFLVYGGFGTDTLKGGSSNDVFFFEGDRLGAGDTINGGPGRDAVIISAGDGLHHIEFAAGALTSVEAISFTARYATDPAARPSYELVLKDANVTSGGALIVNGSSIADPIQTVTIDGSAVQGGALILFGGAGADILIGGAGADSMEGRSGADRLTGGGGADVFRYIAAADSTAAAPDLILDFASGTDKIDLAAIDADSLTGGDQAFHWIGSSAFTGSGAASAGELRAYSSGGDWFVEGDTNGDGSADLLIQLTAPAAPVVQGDFVL